MRICLDHAYTAKEIAAITGGTTQANALAAGYLTTDSREVEPGDLFVALRGEAYDGHRFIEEAVRNGATLLLYEEASHNIAGGILVKSCEAALCTLAKAARDRIAPTVIAITGSNGKTTTKNMVAAVLAERYRTHKTAGNQNNLLGVCLTLLSMPVDTEMLVVEMGMNHEKEIETLSLLASPDVAVITNVGHAHIGNLGSRERIASAKREILRGCRRGAIYLLPSDEPLLTQHVPDGIEMMRIGEGGDCRQTELSFGSNTTVADFQCRASLYPAVPLPGTGKHLALCAAYAIAIGHTFGVPGGQMCHALATVQNDKMRQELIRKNGITVILDCYNASPESMRMACDTLLCLSQEQHGRSLALLGDMMELGEHTRALHEEIGAYYARSGLDLLFTLGAAAGSIADGARQAGMRADCLFTNPNPSDHAASAQQINRHIRHGDVLLIKASRALAAERIAALLTITDEETEDVQA
jgi:UDP-N-acetylmuramoyl-tripeptide--D-alanyl-D-alanine ligase